MDRYAHSLPGRPESEWEPLEAHLRHVGGTGEMFAASFGAGLFGRAMGRLHDIGKCSQAYQDYIRGSGAGGGAKGPDHSSAGAREAFAAYGEQFGPLLAYGIAGHHAGLMDGARLADRRTKAIERHDGWQDQAGALPAPADFAPAIRALKPNAIEKAFTYAFFARMLFSCLVDADFLETERFYAAARGEPAPARGGEIGQAHLEAVRRYMAGHRRADSEVNRIRSTILDHAIGKATLPPGLFTLTVPTGGGKTLTSLSFALEHARRHDLRRIVYSIPYTSIIDQVADEFRKALGPLGGDVLEHHSSFDWDEREPATGADREREGRDGLAKLRRDAENWAAPIVVTTVVQFFESLFAARTGRARKLHNLARSVIVIDEAQSIPVHLLRPCMAAIDELARNYGATVILCTATQPALRLQDRALPDAKRQIEGMWRSFPEGLDIPDDRELAPNPADLYDRLRRVTVEWRREPTADEAIVARFREAPRMLCIVNSRRHARILHRAIGDQPGAVHLTTLMCAKHRRQVLARVRADLAGDRPVRLVATSLIEAGVDISFPEVWRAAAGLANIAQAAGRANRNGERGPLGEGFGRVVIFEPADHPTPPAMEMFYGPARAVLRQDHNDVLGLAAVRDYHAALYRQQGHAALDRARLPGGEPYAIVEAIAAQARRFDFPFATIADAFRMIDETMDPVIVPWDDEARALIRTLHHAELPPAGLQRKLQQYVVPVARQVRETLIASGSVAAIRPADYGDRFVVLVEQKPGELPPLYDESSGLTLDDPYARSSENNIFS